MTSQTRVTLQALFENGDVPTGTNYTDFIDSYVSLIDTTAQSMNANLTVPVLVATTVSAGAVYSDTLFVSGASQLTGTTSAAALFADSITVSGITSAGAMFADSLTVSGITSVAATFADSLTVAGATILTGIVSAGTVHVSAMNFDVETTVAVSNAGSAADFIIVKVAGVDKRIAYFHAEQ